MVTRLIGTHYLSSLKNINLSGKMKKIKTLSLLLLILSLFNHTLAQSLTGIVKDIETGEPLTGANIQVINTLRGTVSNSDGNYSLPITPNKTITIRASFVGYNSIDSTINTAKEKNTTLNFSLKSQPINQEEITITATKIATAKSNVPLTTSVINEKTIASSAEINLMPLIGSCVPGVFVTERGISGFGVSTGAAGKVSVRGVGSGDQSQLLIMIDGQPQVMGIFGHGFPDMYQTSNYEKVEIIRGPASVLYGSNAMGGVVNLITKKQKNDGFSGKVSAQGGSFDTYRGTITTGYKKRGFSVFAAFNHDQTAGHRDNSSFNGNNGHIGIGWEISSKLAANLTANYSAFRAVDPGPATTQTPDIYANEGAWASIKRGNTMLTVSNDFGAVDGHLKVFFNQGDHSIYDGWVSTDRNYGFSLFEGISLFKNNLTGIGVDWNEYGGIGSPVSIMKMVDGVRKMIPSEYNNKWIDVSEQAAYAFMQQTLFDALTLNGGLRYSNHSLYGGTLIPQVGATLTVKGNNQLKALASKGHRSPNVKELYFFPPANPNLEPEKLWNYEIGYTLFALNNKIKASATVFYIKGENLILATPNPAGFPPMLNQNTGNFSHYGAEFEASAQISPSLSTNAYYSYLNTDVPRIASPKHQWYASANYHKGKFDITASLQGIIGLYTLTDNAATPQNEEEKQNYTLLNTKVNYRFIPQVIFFISGDNLLNAEYSTNYGYTMPEVTILAGFSIQFN